MTSHFCDIKLLVTATSCLVMSHVVTSLIPLWHHALINRDRARSRAPYAFPTRKYWCRRRVERASAARASRVDIIQSMCAHMSRVDAVRMCITTVAGSGRATDDDGVRLRTQAPEFFAQPASTLGEGRLRATVRTGRCACRVLHEHLGDDRPPRGAAHDAGRRMARSSSTRHAQHAGAGRARVVGRRDGHARGRSSHQRKAKRGAPPHPTHPPGLSGNSMSSFLQKPWRVGRAWRVCP